MCVLPCVVVELPCLCALCYRGGVLRCFQVRIFLFYTHEGDICRGRIPGIPDISDSHSTQIYTTQTYIHTFWNRHMGKALDVVVGERKSTRLFSLNFASLGLTYFLGQVDHLQRTLSWFFNNTIRQVRVFFYFSYFHHI